MTNRGKKIQCTACGAKYYDLGQKDKPCPKCKNIPISNFKSKFKKKNNDKENSGKLELDFFYINDEKINQFLSVSNNKIKIDTSLFWLRGWRWREAKAAEWRDGARSSHAAREARLGRLESPGSGGGGGKKRSLMWDVVLVCK